MVDEKDREDYGGLIRSSRRPDQRKIRVLRDELTYSV